MHNQQRVPKGRVWKTAGFLNLLTGSSMLLAAALLAFLLQFPPLRASHPVGESFGNLETVFEVFFLLIIPLTFVGIVFIGRGLSEHLGSRRTAGMWMLGGALLMVVFTLPPVNQLVHSITGRDYSWLFSLSYVVSIPLAMVGTAYLVQNLAEVLQKRKAEQQRREEG